MFWFRWNNFSTLLVVIFTLATVGYLSYIYVDVTYNGGELGAYPPFKYFHHFKMEKKSINPFS